MKTIMLTYLAACIGMSACTDAVVPARPPAPVAAPAPIVSAVVLQGHKGLALSALAYDSVAKTATALVRTGVIRGPALDALQEANNDATMALSFGYTATTAAEKARAALAIDGIVARMKALAPGKL